MVSLIKYGGHQNKNDMNFVGKSTDTKPIKTFDGMPISNGSAFYEMIRKQSICMMKNSMNGHIKIQEELPR